MEVPTPTVDAPKPLRFRRTRIAVTVLFGVLAVAMCVLWVRSHWRADSITRVDSSLALTRIGTAVGVCFDWRTINFWFAAEFPYYFLSGGVAGKSPSKW